jgi:hypothetical protein
MSRRKFLKLSGLAAFAASWPAHAQKDLPVVAVLTPGDVRLSDDRIVAIRKGMQEAGLKEGVDYSFARSDGSRRGRRIEVTTPSICASHRP